MSPRNYLLMSLFVGLALLGFSCTMPYFTDEEAAEKLNLNSYNMDVEEYYKQRDLLETDKTHYMDAGIGLVIASGSILGFQFFGRYRRWKDFMLMRSLSRKAIFIGVNIAWTLLAVSFVWYYWYRMLRGDYPPSVDSILVPISESLVFYLLMLIPVNAFLLLTTFNAQLPARIFVHASKYTPMAVAWEVLFGIMLLLNFIVIFEFIIDGDHLNIPITLFFSYVLMSLRAGQITKY